MNLRYNINATLRVAKIELNSMLYSPVAWLVLLAFIIQIATRFQAVFDDAVINQMISPGFSSRAISLFTFGASGSLVPATSYLHLYLPLITMGLMSKEYQSGSIKLLYSSPITNGSIIGGKFIAMMVYGLCLILFIAALMLFCGFIIPNFDYSVVLTAIFGIYLLILAYSAIGIFMSSLTSYQVVAAIGTIATLAAINELESLGRNSDLLREITYWIGLRGRSQSFMDGIISSEDIIYFVIITTMFLLIAIFKLNTEKIIMSRTKKIMGYSSIVIIALLLGYTTTLQSLKLYYDATHGELNTISAESREILNKVQKEKGDIKIVGYTNVLAEFYYNGRKSNRMYDKKRFTQLIRYMPSLKLEYVPYYNINNNHKLLLVRESPDKSGKELAEEVCKHGDFKIEEILSPEEFKKQYLNLDDEGNRYIRGVETEDGERVFIRMFNDNSAEPGEGEMMAAFARLVNPTCKVAFYSDNNSRSIGNYGDKGFLFVTNMKWTRQALINHGFDTKSIDLATENLDNTDILVIMDLVNPITDDVYNKVKEYIDKGGNLYIASDYQRSANMNRLLQLVGITASEGILVAENKMYSPTVLPLNVTQEALKRHYHYVDPVKYERSISVNGAVALDYSKAESAGFKAMSVLESSPEAWVDYNTTDFVDGKFLCEVDQNEKKGVRSVLVDLSRKVGDREQRIIVSGDSDIFANGELSAQRAGLLAANIASFNSSFRWLSNDVYPIDTRDLPALDTNINIGRTGLKIVSNMIMYIVPLLLAALGVFLIVRRERK